MLKNILRTSPKITMDFSKTFSEAEKSDQRNRRGQPCFTGMLAQSFFLESETFYVARGGLRADSPRRAPSRSWWDPIEMVLRAFRRI